MNTNNQQPTIKPTKRMELPDSEQEYFMDGNFDYYSKSKAKKYRGYKFRTVAKAS